MSGKAHSLSECMKCLELGARTPLVELSGAIAATTVASAL